MPWTSSKKLTLKWINLSLFTSTKMRSNRTKANLNFFPNQKKWVLNQTLNLSAVTQKNTLKWQRLSNSNRRIPSSSYRYSKFWRRLSTSGLNTWLISFKTIQLRTSIKSLSSDFNNKSAIFIRKLSLDFKLLLLSTNGLESLFIS
jgi:hypothetical protein